MTLSWGAMTKNSFYDDISEGGRMKYIFMLLTTMLILTGCGNRIDVNAPLDGIYKSQNKNFSINYPSIWSVQELTVSGSPIVKFSTPYTNLMGHRILIVEVMTNRGTTLAESVLSFKRAIASKVEILNDGYTTINGYDAFYYIFRKSAPGKTAEQKGYITVINSKEYSISYGCIEPDFQKYLPLFERIINTFVTY